MNQHIPTIPAEFLVPVNMNGMKGRMLRLPPPPGKKRELLLVYGHHASLERLYGLAQAVNDYAGVTMPDLPGFGGMDSFYKIGLRPTIDNLADYLAAVIKMRYRGKRISIGAVSFGFVIVTRMLQRYPELAGKVDLLVSIVGFAHKNDFTFSRSRYNFYLTVARTFSYRVPSVFFRSVALSPFVLRRVYTRTHNAKHRFAGITGDERKAMTEFEIHLWRINDVRTYMSTSVSFLQLNNCTRQVDLPVWHVSVKADNYFNNSVVEQHLRIIFTDFHEAPATRLKMHAPTIIAGKEASKSLIPHRIRQQLDKDP